MKNSERLKPALVLVTVATIYALIFMERTAPGLITTQLLRTFQIRVSTLSWMTMGQYLIYALLQIPVAIGGRRFRPERLLVMGTLADGLGTLLFGASHSFGLIIMSRIVVGFGDALIWLNIVSVLGSWFSYGVFGRVLGLTAMSGNLGALIATVPLAVWIDGAGWRMPFVVLGAILVTLAGASLVIFTKVSAVQELVVSRRPIPWRDVFGQTRHVVSVSLTHFGVMGPCLGFISIFAVPYLRHSYHFSEVSAGAYLALGLLGSLVGGPIAGWLSDRYGVKDPYRAIAMANLLAWGALVVWPEGLAPWLLGIVFVTLGFATGSSVLTFAAARLLFSSESAGLASGAANTAGFLSAVLVPGVIGLVLARHLGARVEMLSVLPFALSGLVGTIILGRVIGKAEPSTPFASSTEAF